MKLAKRGMVLRSPWKSTIVPFRQNKGQLTMQRVIIDYEIGEAGNGFLRSLLDAVLSLTPLFRPSRQKVTDARIQK